MYLNTLNGSLVLLFLLPQSRKSKCPYVCLLTCLCFVFKSLPALRALITRVTGWKL